MLQDSMYGDCSFCEPLEWHFKHQETQLSNGRASPQMAFQRLSCEPIGPTFVLSFMATVTKTEFEALDPLVLKHLRELNFASVNEYKQWCVEHGFSRGLNKHSSLRAEERRVRQEKTLTDHKQREREARHPLAVLLAICRGELHSEQIQQLSLRYCARRVEAAVQSEADGVDRDVLVPFVERMAEVRAKFLQAATESLYLAEHQSSWLEGLVNVCKFRRFWIRPLEQWRPRGHNVRRQFAGLLRHLFAKYDDVPAFMDSAWLAQHSDSHAYRQWFVHVGQGKNLRHCQLPLGYTKRMAHFFMRAPNTLSIPEALRYGHVLGLGGDERMARAVLSTQLGFNFEHQEFWESVLRWFIAHPMLDRAQVGPIVDYIHHHKFGAGEGFELIAGSGRNEVLLRPNFSMRGRTPESLLRQVHRWHNSLAHDNRAEVQEWLPIGVKPFDLLEGLDGPPTEASAGKSFKRWTIRELLSAQSLIAEGRQLGHCVASYAHSCARRRSSIWTMELITASGVTKLLTVEINPQSRTIVQARGRLNRMPKEQEMKILQRWATQETLHIGNILP